METIAISGQDSINYPGVSYAILVYDAEADLWLDFDDDTFKTYALAVSPAQAMAEDVDVPGVWRTTFSFPAAYTGSVHVYVRRSPDGVIEHDRFVSVSEGVGLIDLARPEVLIGTHTTGFEALRVIDSEGAAVEGAIIRVYTALDYQGSGDEATPVGMTQTDSQGYWSAPVPVSAGETYIVHVHKAYEIGPATREVTV